MKGFWLLVVLSAIASFARWYTNQDFPDLERICRILSAKKTCKILSKIKKILIHFFAHLRARAISGQVMSAASSSVLAFLFFIRFYLFQYFGIISVASNRLQCTFPFDPIRVIIFQRCCFF